MSSTPENVNEERLLGSRRLARGAASVFMSSCAQAASTGDIAMLQQLLKERADPNESTLRGTPLHEACRRGSLRAARLLLDAGSRVDNRDVTGDTPLHCAVA
eukprot:CAMPEP_0113725594 /NCGR_PEP_ID=MMETSP0038_2-20120614/39861_1 /TAXON_ID=2898 /ORGANISM="Cryptomonas paramecium" /LENGTH=101 /DNA_ID=CAMNT_0000655903 /DNA_START=159 /DNA_END=460 /DNA_ORIENTATION=+ /assembly_acc=CAM_ASM_000170